MTTTIHVNRLNKSGRYITTLDYDKAFIDDDNPKGCFKTVVEPFFGETEEDGEILYKKLDKGYIIEGEGYIIAGSEAEINEEIKKNHSYRISGAKHTPMESEYKTFAEWQTL